MLWLWPCWHACEFGSAKGKSGGDSLQDRHRGARTEALYYFMEGKTNSFWRAASSLDGKPVDRVRKGSACRQLSACRAPARRYEQQSADMQYVSHGAAGTVGSRLFSAPGTFCIAPLQGLNSNCACSHSCAIHVDSGRWLPPRTSRMGAAQEPGPRALTALLRRAVMIERGNTAGRSIMASARPPAITGTFGSDAQTGLLDQQRAHSCNPSPGPITPSPIRQLHGQA